MPIHVWFDDFVNIFYRVLNVLTEIVSVGFCNTTDVISLLQTRFFWLYAEM